MDWADDIAYAVSDLEDFVRAGLIPLQLLSDSSEEREAFFQSDLVRARGYSDEDLELRTAAFQSLLAFMPRRFDGSRIDRAMLRSCTSSLISRYISSTSIDRSSEPGDLLKIRNEPKREVEVLKGLTWHYVILRSSLATLHHGQRRVISELFDIFDEGSRSEPAIFPASLRADLESADSEAAHLRVVADAIASMSESQAIEIHQRLTGRSLGSALDDILF